MRVRLGSYSVYDQRDQRAKLARLGARPRIGRDVDFFTPDRIVIGDDVTVNRGCYLEGAGGITIGDNVLIGPMVSIFSVSHRFDDPHLDIRSQGYAEAPVVIERNVWVGTHVVILAGVTVGTGTVVAAGAVVNRDLPPMVVAAGIPAKPIRTRVQ